MSVAYNSFGGAFQGMSMGQYEELRGLEQETARGLAMGTYVWTLTNWFPGRVSPAHEGWYDVLLGTPSPSRRYWHPGSGWGPLTEVFWWRGRTPIREEVWTTHDRRRMNVGDMDVEHLRNVLRMLLRLARKRRTEILVKHAKLAFPEDS